MTGARGWVQLTWYDSWCLLPLFLSKGLTALWQQTHHLAPFSGVHCLWFIPFLSTAAANSTFPPFVLPFVLFPKYKEGKNTKMHKRMEKWTIGPFYSPPPPNPHIRLHLLKMGTRILTDISSLITWHFLPFPECGKNIGGLWKRGGGCILWTQFPFPPTPPRESGSFLSYLCFIVCFL